MAASPTLTPQKTEVTFMFETQLKTVIELFCPKDQ